MSTTAEIITKIYIGYFDRAPDPDGLNYWIGRFNDGMDYPLIAQSFSDQVESTNKYPYLDNPLVASPDTFLNSVYMNLFERAPDAEGLAYWKAQLEDGRPVGEIIYDIINGATDSDAGQDASILANKTAVAYDWVQSVANIPALDYENNDGAKAAAADALDGSATQWTTSEYVTTKEAATDDFVANGGGGNVGDTYNLTGNIDNIDGGDQNDTFKGLFDATQAATGANATSVNTADVLDGKGGTDTLAYLVQGDANGQGAANAYSPVYLSNIEKFQVTNLATDGTPNGEEVHTVALAGVSGVTEVVNQKSVSGVTFTNIGKAAAVTVDGVVSGDTTFTRGTSSITDALTINVKNGVKAGAINSNDTNNDATAAVINSTGAANTTGAINLTGTAVATTHTLTGLTINATADLTTGNITGFDTSKDATITVTGAGKASIGSLAAVVKTVEASANSGGVAFVGGTGLQEVTGGSAKDTVTLGAALADKGFVKLAAGDDVLDIAANAVNKGATIELGAGNDALLGTGSINSAAVVDGGDGVDTLAASLITVSNAGAFKNFEQLDLVGLGNNTLDVALMAANNSVDKLILSGNSGSASATVVNVGADVGLTVTASDTNGVTIDQAGTNATTGAVDTFSITFDAEASDPVAAKTVTAASITLNAIDTVSIVSDGGEQVSNVLSALVSDEMDTLNITGDNDFTLGAVYKAGTTASDVLKTIDASGLSGDLKFDLAAVNGALTVKLGSGDDLITASIVNDGAGGETTVSSVSAMDKIANFDSATAAELDAGKGYDLLKFVDTDATAGNLDFAQASDAAGSTTAVAINDGIVDFSGLANGPQTFAEAVTQINTDVATDGNAVLFEYGSNSYVFVQNDSADIVVELTGVTGVAEFNELGATDSFYIA